MSSSGAIPVETLVEAAASVCFAIGVVSVPNLWNCCYANALGGKGSLVSANASGRTPFRLRRVGHSLRRRVTLAALTLEHKSLTALRQAAFIFGRKCFQRLADVLLGHHAGYAPAADDLLFKIRSLVVHGHRR